MAILGLSGHAGVGKDEVAKMIQYLTSVNTHISYKEWKGSKYDKKYIANWDIKRFADKLKDIVCLLIGCDRKQLENRKFKEKELGKEWRVWYTETNGNRKIFASENNRDGYLSYLNETNFQRYEDTSIGDYILTPRLLLQLLGTECGRESIHQNIWTNSLFADYEPISDNLLDGEVRKVREEDLTYPKWIIPDLRFPNEAKAIKERGGILIRINRLPEITKQIKDTRDFLYKLKLKEPHESETALDTYDNWDYIINNDGSLSDLLNKVKEICEKEEII